MTAAASFLAPASLLLVAGALVAQPVTRPAPPLRPSPVGPAREIVIYRDRNFGGPAVSIPEDTTNLRLAWTVNSARVRGGTWQLCERPNYHGSCLTLTSDSRNLGHRRVQSARTRGGAQWRALGDADISRLGWDQRSIRIRGNQRVSDLRLCAERSRIRIRDARARFSNGRFQTLRVPSQVESGRCTNALALNGSRQDLSSIDLTVATAAIGAKGRIRIEGR